MKSMKLGITGSHSHLVELFGIITTEPIGVFRWYELLLDIGHLAAQIRQRLKLFDPIS